MATVVSKTLLKDGTPGDGEIKLTTLATAKALGLAQNAILLTPPETLADGTFRYTVKGSVANPPPSPPPKGFAPFTVAPPVMPAMPAKPEVRTGGTDIKGSTKHAGFTANGVGLLFRQEKNGSLANPVTSIEITDGQITGCGAIVRNYGQDLSNVHIARISSLDGRYSPGRDKGIFMASGRVSNVTIEDIVYHSTDPITDSGDIYGLITLAGKTAGSVGSGFIFRRIIASGMMTAYTDDAIAYANSDFFPIEGGYSDGLIEDVDLSDAADSIFDIKGARWRINNAVGRRARQTVKSWSDLSIGVLQSENPRFAHHLSARGGITTKYDFWRPIGTNPKIPLVAFENGPATVIVTAADLSGLPDGQVWATADKASKGSKLVLPDRTVQL